MSGPFFTVGNEFDGASYNSVTFNGASVAAALFVRPVVDSLVFDLLIGGKLSVKEKVCGIKPAPRPKKCRPETIVPVCDKVKP